MKSKECLFSKAVFKSDIKRFLPFAIPVLVINLIIFPIIIYGMFSKKDPLEFEAFSLMSIVSDRILYVFAALFGIVVFSYLFRANKCNALHAFPLGRKALFVSNYLAGLVLLILPQLLAFAVAIPGVLSCAAEPSRMILVQLISIIAGSFIFYSTAVLSSMLSGNIFSAAVIYALINRCSSVISLVVSVLVARIGHGLGLANMDVLPSMFNVSAYDPSTSLFASKLCLIDDFREGFFGINEVEFVSFYKTIAVNCIIAVLFTALAFVLYRIRKLECAGDMVAFKITKPIIAVLVAFVASSLVSLFISIFISTTVAGFMLFFAAFYLINIFGVQMILNKTPRVFDKNKLILGFVSCAVIIAAIVFTANYQTNYVPKASKVKSVTVTSSYRMEITKQADIEDVTAFHEALKEKAKKVREGETNRITSIFDRVFDEEFMEGNYYYNNNINIQYTLENGKSVYRSYTIDETDKKLCDMLNSLEGKYPVKTLFENIEDVDYTVTGAYVEQYTDEFDGGYGINLEKAQLEKLLELYKKDSKELLSDYRTFDRFDSDKLVSRYYIQFTCTVDSKEEMEKLEKDYENYITDSSYDLLNISMYIEEGYGSSKGRFTISVDAVPEGTETFDYLEKLSYTHEEGPDFLNEIED